MVLQYGLALGGTIKHMGWATNLSSLNNFSTCYHNGELEPNAG